MIDELMGNFICAELNAQRYDRWIVEWLFGHMHRKVLFYRQMLVISCYISISLSPKFEPKVL